MTDVVNVMDIVFDCDYPEFKSGDSVMFSHRFSYLTECKNKTIMPIMDENCELMLVNDEICIVVKCYCDDEFSEKCLAVNLKLLCKLIMKLIDGTYPLSLPSSSSAESLDFPTELEDMKDFLHNKFCNECKIPVLLCLCNEIILTRQEFLEQLDSYSLCNNCKAFISSSCSCNFKISKVYSFYLQCSVNGLVRKKLNDVKRLVYLCSCNTDMCLNCGRSYSYCLCPIDYRIIYKIK